MWAIIVVFVLFVFLLVWIRRIRKYQEDLFRWHCQEIYPFDKRLSKTELKYIRNCISISWWESFRLFFVLWDPIIPRLSFFTYSQRVQKNKVNKSRVAYGSTVRPALAYRYALKVLEERCIQPPLQPDDNLIFYGLGWDIEEGHLKLYYRFLDFDILNDEYKKLERKGSAKYSRSGLLSWTFDSNNKVLETKLYRYPLDELEAHMFSSIRADRQVDCKKDSSWKDKINEIGQKIVAKYGEGNYLLDTITIKDKDHFTLYFPMAF